MKTTAVSPVSEIDANLFVGASFRLFEATCGLFPLDEPILSIELEPYLRLAGRCVYDDRVSALMLLEQNAKLILASANLALAHPERYASDNGSKQLEALACACDSIDTAMTTLIESLESNGRSVPPFQGNLVTIDWPHLARQVRDEKPN